MFSNGERLIFTRPDGSEEECEMLFRGLVPGCIVVRFFDMNGRYTSHDGLTLPIKRMRHKED